MSNPTSPLKLTLYGVNDEIKREVTRSIIPWGVLELALDLQSEFEDISFDAENNPIVDDLEAFRSKIQKLTEFIIFVFDDTVTENELKHGASIKDMFMLYRQIFAMVAEVMPRNPTTALAKQQADLTKVRQGKKTRQR